MGQSCTVALKFLTVLTLWDKNPGKLFQLPKPTCHKVHLLASLRSANNYSYFLTSFCEINDKDFKSPKSRIQMQNFLDFLQE